MAVSRKISRKLEYDRLAAHITGRFPVAKKEYVKPAVHSKQKEIGSGGVCAECLRWLKSLELWYPCTAERMATGVGLSPVGRMLRYGTKGRSDIYFVLNGRMFYLETKAGSGGYLSQYQIAFKNAVQSAGAVYWAGCSVDELKEFMQPYLELCPKKPGVADFSRDPELQGVEG